MEVKKGYKQTEVGVIPDDWEVKRLGELFEITSSKRVFQSEWKTEGIPFYRARELAVLGEKGYIKNELFISKEMYDAYKNIYGVPKIGDMLVTGVGTLGKVYVVSDDHEFYFKDGNIIWFKISGKVRSDFLRQLYLTQLIIKQIDDASAGTTAGTYTISGAKKTTIPFPPLPEQRAIAASLSDVDALLAALDALIAKKRLVKQGAMQEMLNGKRRVPGFSKRQGYKQTEIGLFPEDWEIQPLKSISSMHGRIGWQGLKQSEFTMKPDDPFLITGMNFKDGEIRWDEVYHIPNTRYEIAKEIQLKTGDVLMTKDGTIGKILYVNQIPYPGKASLNSHLLVFRPLNNKYIPKFLFYQLNSKTFHNHIEQEKSGTTFFGITQEAVGKYNAFLPSIPEQQAIAEILTDMDAEITALEQKREKTRLLKQGMMQELLTGRIRLV